MLAREQQVRPIPQKYGMDEENYFEIGASVEHSAKSKQLFFAF